MGELIAQSPNYSDLHNASATKVKRDDDNDKLTMTIKTIIPTTTRATTQTTMATTTTTTTTKITTPYLNQFCGSNNLLFDQKGGSDIRQGAAQRMSWRSRKRRRRKKRKRKKRRRRKRRFKM